MTVAVERARDRLLVHPPGKLDPCGSRHGRVVDRDARAVGGAGERAGNRSEDAQPLRAGGGKTRGERVVGLARWCEVEPNAGAVGRLRDDVELGGRGRRDWSYDDICGWSVAVDVLV